MAWVNFDPNTELDWNAFFAGQSQVGRGSYFQGAEFQRGGSLGGIFRSLMRLLLPIGKEIGIEGLATSGRLINSILGGEKVDNALKRESKIGLKNLADKASSRLAQSGNGIKVPRKRKKVTRVAKSCIKRRRRDVLGLY